jgi:hypothetical protein
VTAAVLKSLQRATHRLRKQQRQSSPGARSGRPAAAPGRRRWLLLRSRLRWGVGHRGRRRRRRGRGHGILRRREHRGQLKVGRRAGPRVRKSPAAGRGRSLAVIHAAASARAESSRRPHLVGVPLGLAQSPTGSGATALSGVTARASKQQRFRRQRRQSSSLLPDRSSHETAGPPAVRSSLGHGRGCSVVLGPRTGKFRGTAADRVLLPYCACACRPGE